MAYIDWLIDGVEYRTYCGKLSGCIVNSNGTIDPISNPNIAYFGDELNRKLPCNKIWNEVKIKTENGEWYNTVVTITTNHSQIAHSGGYMTNKKITVNNTSIMPTILRHLTLIDIKYMNYRIFSYCPEFYNETYITNYGTSATEPLPIGEVGGIIFNNYLGHYMFFILDNKLGAYPKKQILCSFQPFTVVASQLAYGFIQEISAPAQPWGILPLHFKLRLFWDKNYKNLKNPTVFRYRYSDNKNISYNINWMNGVNPLNELTESNCGRVIYESMMTNDGYVERNLGSLTICRNMNINAITNAEDIEPPDNGDDEQPPDDITPGDGDEHSDDIDFPKPVLNINDFVTIYNFKQEQLKLLANNIWNNNFIDNLLKISNYALDCIICFNAYNFDIETETSEHVVIGNVQFDMGAETITNAYQTVNMGTITIMPFFGDYRDYTNTNIYIYLPFIGMKQLDVEQVQGSKITLKYIVDILTGECLAMIKVTNSKFNSVTQSFKGKCNYSIPLGGENYSRLNTDIAHGVLTKSLTGFIGETISAFERAKQVSIGNNLGGNIALANVLTPYLLFERYDTLSTQNWSQWENWNSYYIESLSNVTGLTRARTSKLIIPLAQENEINEIKSLLEQGVVF